MMMIINSHHRVILLTVLYCWQSLRMTVNMNIKGLEDFKLVMATIGQVQAFTITAEVKYRGMQEIFHMLRQHGIDVSLNFISLTAVPQLNTKPFCSFVRAG